MRININNQRNPRRNQGKFKRTVFADRFILVYAAILAKLNWLTNRVYEVV